MSEHRATVRWLKETDEFSYDTFNREHKWQFESGQSLRASSSPEFLGKDDCVDPEEALVASLASCHMLTFLAVCAKKKLVVTSYEDNPVGYLEKNPEGKLAITRLTLKPVVGFEGKNPASEEIDALHQSAHKNCFIANSIKAAVTIL